MRFAAPVVALLAVTGASAAAEAAPATSPRTIRVPSPQTTIQAAIDESAAGDTVLVGPGLYLENIDFKGKNITVRSARGPRATVIDGQSLGPVVSFRSGESRHAVLQGFTIQHGTTDPVTYRPGGGVTIWYASPSIRENTIVDNHGISGLGIGSSGGSPAITDNLVARNTGFIGTNGMGGGIFVGFNFTGTPAVVAGNRIVDNANDQGGAIGLNGGADVAITGNTMTGNRATYDGGAVYEINASFPTLSRNSITANTAGEGAALYVSPVAGSPTTLNDNLLVGNSSSSLVGGNGQGATIFVGAGSLSVVRTTIIGQRGRAVFRCDTFPGPPELRFSKSVVVAPSGSVFDHCPNVTGFTGR